MKNQAVTIDAEKLKTLSTQSPHAKSIFKYLFDRRRGRQDTNLTRVRRMLREAGHDVPAQEISDVFKGLQDLGVGKVIAARGARRFAWTANLRSIKDVLEGRAHTLARQAPTAQKLDLPVLAADQPVAPAPVAPSGHMLVVRKGAIEIHMPADLTPAEAKSVAALLSLAS